MLTPLMTGGIFEPARAGTLAIRLGVAVFVMALLSSSWEFPEGSDGAVMFATSESLLSQGSLGIDPQFTTNDGYDPGARVGRGGRAYSKYGIGLPLLEVPFVAAARFMARLIGVAERTAVVPLLSLLNPALTALTAVVLFSLCRQFVGIGVAYATTAAYAFGTFGLVHATTDNADPLQALLIKMGALLLVRYRKEPQRTTLAMSGAALAAAVLAKPANVIALPVFVAYILIVAGRQRGGSAGVEMALFVTPLLASLSALGWLNWMRFGSVTNSGYPGRISLTGQSAGGSVPVNLGFRLGSVPGSAGSAVTSPCRSPLPAAPRFQLPIGYRARQ